MRQLCLLRLPFLGKYHLMGGKPESGEGHISHMLARLRMDWDTLTAPPPCAPKKKRPCTDLGPARPLSLILPWRAL